MQSARKGALIPTASGRGGWPLVVPNKVRWPMMFIKRQAVINRISRGMKRKIAQKLISRYLSIVTWFHPRSFIGSIDSGTFSWYLCFSTNFLWLGGNLKFRSGYFWRPVYSESNFL